MSRSSDAPSRTLFASKTTFEALNVESGEDSEEEERISERELPQDSLPRGDVKMSKGAMKKASRLARIERRQRQKNKPQPDEGDRNTSPPQQDNVSPGTLAPSVPKEDIASSQTIPLTKLRPPVVSEVQTHDELNDNGSAGLNAVEVQLANNAQQVDAPCLPTELQGDNVDLSTRVDMTLDSSNNGALVQRAPSQSLANGQSAEQEKKRQNMLTRTLWTFIMIGGFVALLLLGHTYMILLVMLCQTLVYREVTALFSLKTAVPEARDSGHYKGKDPWSKTLNWYFFAVTNYFLYGESIIYYFKHVVFADANLSPFATNHRMISFTLYIIGFMGFVMSLKKGFLKQQFGLFCWVHMSLLLIVVSSHFIVNNILEGLIWFWVPASLVICNDCFAYIWGSTIGRTPLIKLSPKKTVEGFVGAFLSTIAFALAWGTWFMRYDYMICPVHDLGVSAFTSTSCTPNPIFVWRTVELWTPLATFLSTLTGFSISAMSYAPYQLHLFMLACFASLVAPFGGFFASGFKRAFNIKDFGHSIPGHGGMTDRMDCQFLMGIFTYVYYSSLIRVNNVTVGKILETIVSGLSVDQQLELIRDLSRYLEGQGVTV